MPTAMISGHLNLTEEEFNLHYKPKIDEAIEKGHSFVVGDARGTDEMGQRYLFSRGIKDVTVYHPWETCRNNPHNYPVVKGYTSYTQRDAALTSCSDYDIAWTREGREGDKSGTGRNILRRQKWKDQLRAIVRKAIANNEKHDTMNLKLKQKKTNPFENFKRKTE
jgi:hypothetical protein